MDLTLTEVLDVLLRAEDESGKQRDSAKREAEEVNIFAHNASIWLEIIEIGRAHV